MDSKIIARHRAVAATFALNFFLCFGATSSVSAQTQAPLSGVLGAPTCDFCKEFYQQEAQVFAKMLQSPDPEVRRLGVKNLAKSIHKETVFAALSTAIAQDPDDGVRADATCALGFYSARHLPGYRTVFIRALNDTSEGVRICAAMSLGNLRQGSPEIVSSLLERLEKEEFTTVRWAVAGALGHLGPSAQPAIPALKALAAKGGRDGLAAEQAIKSIER